MRVEGVFRMARLRREPRWHLEQFNVSFVAPPIMSSQARVNALSKFCPPGTILTPVGLLDAKNATSTIAKVEIPGSLALRRLFPFTGA